MNMGQAFKENSVDLPHSTCLTDQVCICNSKGLIFRRCICDQAKWVCIWTSPKSGAMAIYPVLGKENQDSLGKGRVERSFSFGRELDPPQGRLLDVL
ncbi:hypothetical protein CC2G_014464 [Coprinopsis cinerea AmutBmut pab1-1]|nr:hypothetical protein CC2G_014464 [Coprinopsis cinerea AmutBmut pab1-1]